MTTLAITPNWKNKTAKFKGTVAAGEHVSVTIQNENGEGGEFIEDVSTLRLRVVDPCNGRTLAIFPEPVPEGETPETWDSDLSPLRCTLNLNTVQMLKSVPPAANVPLLWVLDDYDNNTLYFKEQFPVEHWPRQRGEEEPTDLDNYKDIIEDFNTRLTTAEQTVADAAANAQSAANSASAAASSAATAATAATDAQAGAMASKNAAQTAANDAASAKAAAETAQGKAEAAQEAAETAQGKAQEYAEAAAESAAAFVVDDTLSVEGAAADAKAVGEANQDLITQIETVQDNLDAETTARETLGSAVQVDRQNLANEIARAQSAEQSLENRKADKAMTYTKAEVDAKVAGVQTFKKYLVQTLPDADEADMKGLYLVPTGETSEEGDLCEEWTVVDENGEKRWEKIGGTTVDLSDYYTKTETNTLLAGKASKADATLTALTGFSDWVLDVPDGYTVAEGPRFIPDPSPGVPPGAGEWRIVVAGGIYGGGSDVGGNHANEPNATEVVFTLEGGVAITATRTVLQGYRLGTDDPSNPNRDKPLASEAEAEALRQGKQDALTFDNAPTTGSNNPVKSGGIWSAIWGALSALPTGFSSLYDWCVTQLANVVHKTGDETIGGDKTFIGSNTVIPFITAGHGSIEIGISGRISQATAGGLLDDTYVPNYGEVKSAIPYDLGTPTVIDTASSEVVEGETVYYGAATLADRTANIVQVTAATALDELRITFPAATSGKVRDFGLRVEIGTGSAALTAPALIPIAPTGETIKIENNAKEIPALADGTATAKGVTLLYFSENAPGVFVVKGEQVEEVA